MADLPDIQVRHDSDSELEDGERRASKGSQPDANIGYWQQIAKEAAELTAQKREKAEAERQSDDEETSKPEVKEVVVAVIAEPPPPSKEEEERQAKALSYWKDVAAGVEASRDEEERLSSSTEEEDEEAAIVEVAPRIPEEVEDNKVESHEPIEESAPTPTTSKAYTPPRQPQEDKAPSELEQMFQQRLNKGQPVARENHDDDDVIVTPEEVKERLQKKYSMEKSASNVEVLEALQNEAEDEDDRNQVSKILSWAKSTRRPKTETFVIKAKKKEETMKRAIDFGAMSMVIEDRSTKTKDGVTTISSGNKKFEVIKYIQIDGLQAKVVETNPKKTFQVRKTSLITPPSESIVTKEWVTNAVSTCEQENEVEVLDMKFEAKDGGNKYEAFITARIARMRTKTYHWIITPSPKSSINFDPKDKDIFMISELGSNIARYVVQKRFKKPISVPFQPVILADNQFAIFDDISNYKVYNSDVGYDLEHMKQALKGLAKLHALSYAFFNKDSAADMKNFSEVLKLMIDKQFQPSATSEDKRRAKEELETGFEKALALVAAQDQEGGQVAQDARKKFNGRLYDICKAASVSSSKFSVLCHGFPTTANFHFLYNDEQKPTDVKLIGFQRARYAHAVTDLQILFSTSKGPRVEEQTEFLLRFVYYETLAGTLKAFNIGTSVIEYESLLKEFKNKQVYGSLMGAIHIAGGNLGNTSKPVMNARRATGKRVFESKFLGKMGGASETTPTAPASAPSVNDFSPGARAKALLIKALKN